MHIRSVRSRVPALLAVAAALVVPMQAAALTTVQFVENAFAAVGVSPACEQVSLESDALVYYLARNPNPAALKSEAARFVSSLFTASYQDPPPAWFQTGVYNQRNPVFHGSTNNFVTDLFSAFLQRPPDSGGFTFWVNSVNSYSDANAGRSYALAGFATSGEFLTLAGSLQADSILCP